MLPSRPLLPPIPSIVTVRTVKRQRDETWIDREEPAKRKRQSRPSKRYRRALGHDSDQDDNYVESDLDVDLRKTKANLLAEQQGSDPTLSLSINHKVEARLSNKSRGLAQICLRKASQDAVSRAGATDDAGQFLRTQLMQLPSHLATRLLCLLLQTSLTRQTLDCVNLLLASHPTAFILPPGSVQLSNPYGRSILAKASLCPLTVLDLSTQKNLQDTFIASLLVKLPFLTSLSLRGCVNAGDEALLAIPNSSCQRMEKLNLSHTASSAKALTRLFGRCLNLRVLKLTGLIVLTDNKISSLVETLLDKASPASGGLPLGKIRALKLKGTKVTEVGLARLVIHMPHLESIDLSFTHTRSFDILIDLFLPRTFSGAIESKIRKLVLSGLGLNRGSLSTLSKAISDSPAGSNFALEKLKLSSMGSFTFRAGRDPEKITGPILRQLAHALARCPNLAHLTLSHNESINTFGKDLSFFLGTAGRKCQSIDLSHTIASYGSLTQHNVLGLAGASGAETSASVKVLNLSNTRVDDAAIETVAQACPGLQELYLQNSRVSTDGLKYLMDRCPDLHILDLAGCRGIPLQHRRDAFTSWQDGELSSDED